MGKLLLALNVLSSWFFAFSTVLLHKELFAIGEGG